MVVHGCLAHRFRPAIKRLRPAGGDVIARPVDHVLQTTAGKGIPFHLLVPSVGVLKLILSQLRQKLVELLPGKRLDLVGKFLNDRDHHAFMIARLGA
jgi:hypothetical protein